MIGSRQPDVHSLIESSQTPKTKARRRVRTFPKFLDVGLVDEVVRSGIELKSNYL